MEYHHIFCYYNKQSNNYMCEDVFKDKETQFSSYGLRVAIYMASYIWWIYRIINCVLTLSRTNERRLIGLIETHNSKNMRRGTMVLKTLPRKLMIKTYI
jgi:hypothetical protein